MEKIATTLSWWPFGLVSFTFYVAFALTFSCRSFWYLMVSRQAHMSYSLRPISIHTLIKHKHTLPVRDLLCEVKPFVDPKLYYIQYAKETPHHLTYYIELFSHKFTLMKNDVL